MKINIMPRSRVKFVELEVGDPFIYNDKRYIKIASYSSVNALDLASMQAVSFSNITVAEVQPATSATLEFVD